MSKRTKKVRAKKRFTVADLVRKFEVGQKVSLAPSARREGMPNPRYANRTGTIVAKRGNSYVVRFRDGNMMKEIIAHPIHLKLA
jgi:large subunit ribosomal protein L21e